VLVNPTFIYDSSKNSPMFPLDGGGALESRAAVAAITRVILPNLSASGPCNASAATLLFSTCP
jgi:hypothetical protein